MKSVKALPALVLACASPGLRGATSVDPESEPRFPATATLRTASCRDESGNDTPGVALEFGLVEPTSGPKLLLERRQGHDSVVIQNVYDDAGAHVFAYVSNDARHPGVLHRVRLSADASAGELAVSRVFRTHDTPQGFRVDAERVVLRCALVRLQSDADAAHGNASR
jgi:hypothetical protein